MEPNTVFGQEKFTESESVEISNILSQSLPEEEASFRPGPGGTTVTYLESWRAINLANKIFKFNGWSSSIKELSPDFIEEIIVPGGVKYKVGVTAIVRVTLKDGTYQEDVGYGCSDNPSKGTAIENAKKEAVSDARKRTLRLFGDGLGNSLYDKEANKQLGITLKNAKKNAAKPPAKPNTSTTPTPTPAPAPTTTAATNQAPAPKPTSNPPLKNITNKPFALPSIKQAPQPPQIPQKPQQQPQQQAQQQIDQIDMDPEFDFE
ncbi:hypothetical protein DICPUDRAFT_148248 [Dictyostelium purpureum]|uniref:Uncharacterized protein n=1 Tax=Dictyostelium purpureum TaxID=5786 RepID=F0ZAM5_DICPU|nr:uncharacterized protein DICPUDRAFT_148248 [Dictyostelium purpureum]EGC39025.1 hypothetical protein DICPUDRAFT_148248 [Dictyostelium purpureum]|eukprot:XP_003284478.1 hypothetical protein DICPUDRAFT_148248 [Dictyostelium purpureum]